MAIDVLIKQKLFGNKTVPLEVILGDSLHYGNFESDRLNIGELGETEFLAYNPRRIGRGFSVIWNPAEKKSINLRLPMPSTTEEIKDFYGAIERIATYWGAKTVDDGSKTSLKDFMAGLDEMISFNDRTVKHFAKQVIDGEFDTLTLYSAMWPLAVGKEEAEAFLADTGRYATWLHEKQSMDVYCPGPDLYMGDKGVFGRYIVLSGIPTLLPNKPSVPFGVTDPEKGEPLKCEKWVVMLGIRGEKSPLCEMEYSEFLKLLPENKICRYDGDKFLLSELTEEETKAIAKQ